MIEDALPFIGAVFSVVGLSSVFLLLADYSIGFQNLN